MVENFSKLTREQKEEWYASLKAGDKVIVKYSSYGIRSNTTYHEVEVKSITKTGRINVELFGSKHTFAKDGRYWGNRGDTWSRVSYELRQKDQFFINHKREVIARTIFEESMKKLENIYKTVQSVEEIEMLGNEIHKLTQKF